MLETYRSQILKSNFHTQKLNFLSQSRLVMNAVLEHLMMIILELDSSLILELSSSIIF
jgi:hypothetical protein